MILRGGGILLCALWLVSGCMRANRGSSQTERNVTYCPSANVTITEEDLLPLTQCDVIEGSLRIQYVDFLSENKTSLSRLKQITGYLLIQSVSGLATLDDIFPNLTTIRGEELFGGGYALVITSNIDLQELGLQKLDAILKGSVWLEKNWLLCGVRPSHFKKNTRLLPDEAAVEVKVEENPLCLDALCDIEGVCGDYFGGPGKFWRHNCPTCPSGCDLSTMQCCHEQCIGGCSSPADPTACHVCRNFISGSECVPACSPSPGKELIYSNYRCFSLKECQAVGGSPSGESGSRRCLPDSAPNCDEESEECVRTCNGTTVTGWNLRRDLRGCTHIRGSLNITVSGGQNLTRELAANLGKIRYVSGYVRVYGSNSLFSLGFLKRLEVIGGEERMYGSYSLYVLENANLQQLWDWNHKPRNFRILKGSILFRSNPRLCPEIIQEFATISHLQDSVESSLSRRSNGYKIPCEVETLSMHLEAGEGVGTVLLRWGHIYCGIDTRQIMNYTIFYRQVPEYVEYVSLFENRDACSDKELWNRMTWVFHNEKDKLSGTCLQATLTHLRPSTRYAVYLQLQTTTNGNSGAQSPIKYVVTNPENPKIVENFEIEANDTSHVTLDWMPPRRFEGFDEDIVFYILNLEEEEEDMMELAPACSLPRGRNLKKRSLGAPSIPPEDQPKAECCACPKEETPMAPREDEIAFVDQLNGLLLRKEEPEDSPEPTDEENLSSRLCSKRCPDLTPDRDIDWNNMNITIPVYFPLQTGKSKPVESFQGTQSTVVLPFHQLSYIFTSLKHFTKYKISIRACREEQKPCPDDRIRPSCALCSPLISKSARTRPDVSMDGVEMEVSEIDELQPVAYSFADIKAKTPSKSYGDPEARTESEVSTTEAPVNISSWSLQNQTAEGEVESKSLRVVWRPPATPNGLVIAYRLQCRRVDYSQKIPMTVCLSEETAKARNYTHVFSALPRGLYNISIRVESLGASEAVTFEMIWVGGRTMSLFTVYSTTVGSVLVCSILVAAVVWFRWRRIRAKNPDAIYNSIYCTLVQQVQECYVLNRESLTVYSKMLGEGSFGKVFEGRLRHPDGREEKVAVKTLDLSRNKNDLQSRKKFLDEGILMQGISSHYVVRLIGIVVNSPPFYVVMELLERGDLKTHLKKLRKDGVALTEEQMAAFATQAADGMAYLASKKLVHRDLAARNCMLNSSLTLKIGDLGLSRYMASDYYRSKCDQGRLLPVRWMAPESLTSEQYSSRSDVWSYGILLWEIVTYGARPYEDLLDEEISEKVGKCGVLLQKPPDCPKFMSALMTWCWKSNPKERPTFVQLVRPLLPRTTPDFLREFEKNSYFQSCNCCDSESTEDNDEGFIASCSLDASLEDHLTAPSPTPSFQPPDDEQFCLTPDDSYKRRSCVSLACMFGGQPSQSSWNTPSKCAASAKFLPEALQPC